MTQSAFKQFEHQAWETVVNEYDAAFSRLTQQVIPAMIEALAVEPGTALLDVACGPGYLAAAASAKGAVASGSDFSAEMVVHARRSHPDIDFRQGDAETLSDYADRSFDAVGMNFGILHLDQPDDALRSICRVLRPDGRLAFTAWAPEPMVVGFSIPLKAIQEVGNPNVGLPPGPPFFHFSDAGNCKDALTRCGFRDVETRIVDQIWDFDTPDDFFDALLRGTARTGGALKRQTPEQLAAVRDHIRNAARAYATEGKIRLPMPAHLVWASKHR